MAADGSEEQFTVILRRTKESGIQILPWFATVCTAGADKVVGAQGLQTEVEDYESAFFGVDEAMRVATFQVHRDVIGRAVELVRGTYPGAEQCVRLNEPRVTFQKVGLPTTDFPSALSTSQLSSTLPHWIL